MKSGSFSRAAKVSFRSQPAVSRHIQRLESELGIRLFERFGPMRLKPTEEAGMLKNLAVPLIAQFESLKTRLDEKRGRLKTLEVRIVTHESAKMSFLKAFAKFQSSHPGVKISLIRRDRKEAVAMVLEGAVDFGITSLDKIPPGIQYRVFASYNRVLLIPKKHALAQKERVQLRDIAGYPLILPPPESRIRRTVQQSFRKARLTPHVALEISGRDSAKAYVASGLGLSIMNEYYMTEADRENIKCVDVSQYFGQAKRGIILRKDKTLSGLQNELIRGITQEEAAPAAPPF